MRTPILATLAAAVIAIAAALVVGCEHDVDPFVPSDGVIQLQANPATIVLDPNDPFAPRDPPETGPLVGKSTIYARVFDKTGHPLQGIAITFTTTSGRLASASNPGQPPRPINTDPNGVATDTLTIKESDPTDSTVTAASSIVSESVVVKRTTANCNNAAPVANAGPDQAKTGDVEQAIVLDGSSSSDAETALADLLFVWDCGNDEEPVAAPGSPALFPRVVQCTYQPSDADPPVPVVYTATLTVTDTGNGLEDPRTGDFLCKESKTDTVKITITPSAR